MDQKESRYSFFKNIIASFLGILIYKIVVWIFIFVVIIGGIIAAFNGMIDGVKSDADNNKPLTEISILKFELNDEILDYSENNPFSDFLPEELKSFKSKKMGLNQIIGAIKSAAMDPKIKAIYLNVDDINAGYAITKEIRDQLLAFKLSGKKIYAYSDYYTEKAYYLCSVADSIFVAPEGGVEFKGLSTDLVFFKKALDKYKIEAHVFKVGKYKSAVEPFLRSSMSEANREQITKYLESIYSSVLDDISVSRRLPSKVLRNISDEFLAKNASEAVQYGLIDKTMYFDELEALFKKQYSVDEKNIVAFSKYSQEPTEELDTKIGVIYASGEIGRGNGNDSKIGSETLIKKIKQAQNDSSIKAVVLRVNSPGGSALASDNIWNAIKELKKVKPVIASMSDVAASGGYYISMACDSIFAQSNTITGSIGVFGISFGINHFLEDNFGITSEGVKTGKYSNLYSPFRDMTPQDSIVIQSETQRVYDVFTSKAAKDRKMTLENLIENASGRVWTGKDAVEIGLVDKIGGFDRAIESAVLMSGLKEYSVEVIKLKENKDVFQQIFGDEIKINLPVVVNNEDIMKQEYLDLFNKIGRMETIQARMLPFELNIR